MIRGLFLLSAFWGLGCQKASPNLSSLTSLSGVTLDQSYKTVTSSTQAVTVTGKCNKNFSNIEASGNDGKTWTSVKSLDTAASIDCANSGFFSTSLVPASASATMAAQIDSGSTVSLVFRGNGTFGASTSQTLSLSKSGPTPSQSITYGSNLSSNASFRLTSRLSGTPILAANNGTFILKSSLRAQ